MITEQDLQAAIAECEGQRNPNANTCIKLAAFYTIREHLFPKTEVTDHIADVGKMVYSGASDPEYDSGTEFSHAVKGMDINTVLEMFDEVMTALQVLHPRLYTATIHKIFDKNHNI